MTAPPGVGRAAAALRTAWRGMGGDLPYGDPLPSHHAPMEGYLWRFTDPVRRTVLLVACGINRHRRGPWATVLLAAEPGGQLHWSPVDEGWAATDAYRLRAGRILDYAEGRLRVRVGSGAELEARLQPTRVWPRRALPGGGLFGLLPGLNHYWHPHLFGARVAGRVRLGTVVWDLSRSQVYAEKSWGRGFPSRWWWGQAQDVAGDEVSLAFAGGHLALGPVGAPVNGLVMWLRGEVVRLVPPLAVVRGGTHAGQWRVLARNGRYRVEVEGESSGGTPALPLPVPVPGRRDHLTVEHHLAARLRLTVWRDGRRLLRGESTLASLEVGGTG
ncbi:hypothetical protein AQ490_18770 [Wenjunlia vitaminophila]|uniref:Tocopherol cyclase n=1 Tax=Wenjunlia vitaminophila TaxID=76728 RepID=A0A0T6LV74_WENVI|nr:tocopherol cyclase family protein [Wenjunlia vitaminophila]KRV49746.1 hypothetical protein AQ490_18770 [Wenjunlia vitaminophila]